MIYSSSKFQVQNTVLTLVTILYIRCPNLIHLITEGLHPFTNICLFPPLSNPWEPLFYGSMSLTFLEFTYKYNHMVCLLVQWNIIQP